MCCLSRHDAGGLSRIWQGLVRVLKCVRLKRVRALAHGDVIVPKSPRPGRCQSLVQTVRHKITCRRPLVFDRSLCFPPSPIHFPHAHHFASPPTDCSFQTTPNLLFRVSNQSQPQSQPFIMPLVVPGVTANNLGDSKTQEWLSKLMGKTLTDGDSNETVSFTPRGWAYEPASRQDDTELTGRHRHSPRRISPRTRG